MTCLCLYPPKQSFSNFIPRDLATIRFDSGLVGIGEVLRFCICNNAPGSSNQTLSIKVI